MTLLLLISRVFLIVAAISVVCLSLYVEVDAPHFVTDRELLAFICHLFREVRQDILRGESRKEPMSLISALLIRFQAQQDRVLAILFCLSQLGVVEPSVNFVSDGVPTPRLTLDVRLHCLLAFGLLPSDVFVGLMAHCKLFSYLIGRGEFA